MRESRAERIKFVAVLAVLATVLLFIVAMMMHLYARQLERQELDVQLAKDNLIEEREITTRIHAYKFCMDGYRFMTVHSGLGGGVVQLMENTPEGPRLVECKR